MNSKINDFLDREYRLLEKAPIGVIVLRDGIILEINSSALTTLGYSNKKELIGLSPVEVSPLRQINLEESSSAAKKKFEEAKEKSSCEFEWLHIKKNGSNILLKISLQYYQTVDLFVAYWHNITDFKNKTKIYNDFMNNFPGACYIKNSKFEHIFLNKFAQNIPTKGIDFDNYKINKYRTIDLFDDELARQMDKVDLELINGETVAENIYKLDNIDEKKVKWIKDTKFKYTDVNKETYIGGISLDITDLMLTKSRLEAELKSALSTLHSITNYLDPYTAGHEMRVSGLSVEIGKRLGLSELELEGLRVAGLLHDIGKISIPLGILSKPGKLTNIEFLLIKEHTQVGYEIVKNIPFEWPIHDVILQHHERLDGTGYPNGLTAKDIRFESKIIAVADVVAAMSNHRPYRAALDSEIVLEELKKGRGTIYDSKIIDICLEIMELGLHNIEGWET